MISRTPTCNRSRKHNRDCDRDRNHHRKTHGDETAGRPGRRIRRFRFPGSSSTRATCLALTIGWIPLLAANAMARPDEPAAVEEKKAEVAAPVLVPAPTAPLAAAPAAENATGEKEEEKKNNNDPFAELMRKHPQFGQHVQQVRNSVEWTFGSDLSLAARVCEATLEEKLKIKHLAQAEVHQLLVVSAEQMMRQFMPQRRARNRAIEEKKLPSFRKMRYEATKRILTAVYPPNDGEENGDPTKLDRWEEQRVLRERYIVEANTRVFVGVLNKRMLLSNDQRTKLTDSIASHWDDQWESYIRLIVHNPEFFPPIPDVAIVPHLTKPQRTAWNAMTKSTVGFTFGQVNVLQGMFQDARKRNVWFDTTDYAAPPLEAANRNGNDADQDESGRSDEPANDREPAEAKEVGNGR